MPTTPATEAMWPDGLSSSALASLVPRFESVYSLWKSRQRVVSLHFLSRLPSPEACPETPPEPFALTACALRD